MMLIYDSSEGLFWHNGSDPRNEGMLGWGSPDCASRYSIYEIATTPELVSVPECMGPHIRWTSENDEAVLNWKDPEEGW